MTNKELQKQIRRAIQGIEKRKTSEEEILYFSRICVMCFEGPIEINLIYNKAFFGLCVDCARACASGNLAKQLESVIVKLHNCRHNQAI